ncbi:hypothetical protein FOZ63_004712 [Perkinsus olseni]|uniref:Uncharacterized protein n=1 Tax=Perkinsus olseni TaxID=32597 RepID=A0A7J6R5Y4_PEROL|nr:hypothetical protein FOZ62_007085 [Perkinsus olseni]KAF4721435.1 hypothetical protein FOZ63_004712 [Perkinsus olseni]
MDVELGDDGRQHALLISTNDELELVLSGDALLVPAEDYSSTGCFKLEGGSLPDVCLCPVEGGSFCFMAEAASNNLRLSVPPHLRLFVGEKHHDEVLKETPLSGCSERPEYSRKDESVPFGIFVGREPLKMGAQPFFSAEVIHRKFHTPSWMLVCSRCCATSWEKLRRKAV